MVGRILEERRKAAQRTLASSFDPDCSVELTADERRKRVAFALFKSFSRDTFVGANDKSREQSFERRFENLHPNIRKTYDQMADDAIRAAH